MTTKGPGHSFSASTSSKFPTALLRRRVHYVFLREFDYFFYLFFSTILRITCMMRDRIMGPRTCRSCPAPISPSRSSSIEREAGENKIRRLDHNMTLQYESKLKSLGATRKQVLTRIHVLLPPLTQRLNGLANVRCSSCMTRCRPI